VSADPAAAVAERVAGIDCGTNSVRLLVVEVDHDGRRHELHREMRIVRLGQGVDRTGRITAAALERMRAALSDYAATLQELRVGPDRIRFVATSAARDAANRAEFEGLVEDVLGVAAHIVTGAVEAELSLRGAAAGLPPGPLVVVDIGGGSTEFVLGDRGGVRAAVSLDIGSVRLTERCFASDPPTTAQLAAADRVIADALQSVPPQLRLAAGASRLVGVAGTVTTIAALALGLSVYDRAAVDAAVLPAGAIARVSAGLLASTAEQRAARPVIHPGRVDVIAAGGLILRTVLDWSGAPSLTVSEHDILDGIVDSVITDTAIVRRAVPTPARTSRPAGRDESGA
jgi:exopolyphosphatase/guanosine-5'-triphosphate,3'-diphosphate pyrophosphatase